MLKQENPGSPRSSIQDLAKKMAQQAFTKSGKSYLAIDEKVQDRYLRHTKRKNPHTRNPILKRKRWYNEDSVNPTFRTGAQIRKEPFYPIRSEKYFKES